MQLHPHYPHHLNTPLPPSLPIPSPVDRRDDIPESEQPPRKRLHLSTIRSRYEIGESSTAITVREAIPGIAPKTKGERPNGWWEISPMLPAEAWCSFDRIEPGDCIRASTHRDHEYTAPDKRREMRRHAVELLAQREQRRQLTPLPEVIVQALQIQWGTLQQEGGKTLQSTHQTQQHNPPNPSKAMIAQALFESQPNGDGSPQFARRELDETANCAAP
ncbi:hypothetical protein Tco_0835814 [Tanacetum coccineum]